MFCRSIQMQTTRESAGFRSGARRGDLAALRLVRPSGHCRFPRPIFHAPPPADTGRAPLDRFPAALAEPSGVAAEPSATPAEPSGTAPAGSGVPAERSGAAAERSRTPPERSGTVAEGSSTPAERSGMAAEGLTTPAEPHFPLEKPHFRPGAAFLASFSSRYRTLNLQPKPTTWQNHT